MLNTKKIKQDFPIFQRRINNKSLIYLDSASTSQKPQVVIDTVANFYKTSNANIHRGIYTISEEATVLFEDTRKKVADFIGAKDASEIIFTHNTTYALNIAAYGLAQFLQKDDVILISEMEHHSNHVPWYRVAKEKGARLLFIAIDAEGLLTNDIKNEKDQVVYRDISEIPNLKIVSLAHVSNVLGTINPIGAIISSLRAKRSNPHKEQKIASSQTPRNDTFPIIVIDAAQSVPYMPVDVQKLDCDFIAFSGHKMLAPTGVGILWGRKKLLEEMEPLLIGSHMISQVSKENIQWDRIPGKFEPGTAAIESVIGLSAAIDYLNSIGMDTIKNHESRITNYALEQLKKIDELTIYGPKDVRRHSGVISFNIEGVHSHDVAQILNENNICIRSGHHCAMPLHQRLQAEASARVSFYLYNDENDVNLLVKGIKKVKKVFKS